MVVKGITYENVALAPEVVEAFKAKYGATLEEATLRGQQEIFAEILERPEHAIFRQEVLEQYRVDGLRCRVKLIVLGVDPSRSRSGGGDEAGGCLVALGEDDDLYVLEDCSVRGSPLAWMRHFASVYARARADLAVYEENRLDEGLRWALHDETRGQHWEHRKATEPKAVRAEPVAAACEAGRVHLVGRFPELEEQLVQFDPALPKGQRDDRLDAFVWACRELMGKARRRPMQLA